jgi:hypothetical protein
MKKSHESINYINSMSKVMDYKEKSSFLWDVLKRYDHYIATTNFKIGLMLSFLGVIIFGIFSQKSEYSIACLNLVALLAIMFSLLAVFFLLRAAYPNVNNSNNIESLISFSSVSQNSKDDFLTKIKNLEEDRVLTDLSCQVHEVSGIVEQKFKDIKVANNIVKFIVLPLLVAFISIMVV